MTFPTDAATITRRKSFGICGPAIVASSYFLGFISRFHRFAARGAHVPLADPSSSQCKRRRNWGKQQREREQAQTHAPSDALARPRAHFPHDEFFTLAHFSVGFEE